MAHVEPSDAKSMMWQGWYRAGRYLAWHNLAEGESFDSAWDKLLVCIPQEGPGGESIVLPLGVHPHATAAAKREKERRARQ